MIIGITGHKFSGKSTMAEMLSQELGYEIRSFATKLKEMTSLLSGCDVSKLEDYDFKEHEVVPEFLWPYCTNDKHNYRSLLQGLGDHMREKNSDIFVESVFRGGDKDMIISDCRFVNEAQAIKNRGGVIIRIVRNGCEEAEAHRSEMEVDMIAPDYIIYNNKDKDVLRDSVQTLIEVFKVFNVD